MPVGFWSEHSDNMFPSVFDSPIDHIENSEMVKVANYLDKCPICVASPGIVFSAFHPDVVAGTSSLKTDGSWVWHDTLAYYVSKHGVALPQEFLDQIRHRGYAPLKENDVDFDRLAFPW